MIVYDEIKNLVKDIYTNSSHTSRAAFSNPYKVYREVKLISKGKPIDKKITLSVVKQIMSSIPTYSLHKPLKARYLRNPIVVPSIHSIWFGDLCDMTKLSRHNEGIKFILVMCDGLSRSIYLAPLKRKTGNNVRDGICEIFERIKQKPITIMTDRGLEFLAKEVKEFLNASNVYLTIANVNQPYKSALAENAVQQIKRYIYRMLHENKTKKYINKIRDIESDLNNRYLDSIKMRPSEVNVQNQIQVYRNLYANKKIKPLKRDEILKIGDKVRVEMPRWDVGQHFKKGYSKQWSDEIFVIKKILRHHMTRYMTMTMTIYDHMTIRLVYKY